MHASASEPPPRQASRCGVQDRPPAGGAQEAALAIIGARFPGIADRIRLFWDGPAQTDGCRSSLMVMGDDRQQGFPLDVMSVLFHVCERHRARRRGGDTDFSWAGDALLHEAFRQDEPRR